MIGGSISSSNPSNQDEIPAKSLSGNTFVLGSEDFPSLIPSTSLSNVGSEKGFSENPNPDMRQNRLGMSYVGCLNNNTQSTAPTKLKFDEVKMIDGQSTAIFSSGELKSQISLCESYVVGYFVEKKLPFHLVKESLKSQWNLKGDFTMTIHGEKAYMFKFNQEEDREKVLEMGSVFMAKNLFIIQPWSVSLEKTIDSITSVPIWMNLRQVPFHLWNQLGLSRIASIVGVPIMTDMPTAMKTRMSYARILVEVSGDCSFPTELPIQIDGVKSVVKAEYPWRPNSCSHCKSFGHSSAKCSLHPAPQVVTKWVPKTKYVAQDMVKESATCSTMETSCEDRVMAGSAELIGATDVVITDTGPEHPNANEFQLQPLEKMSESSSQPSEVLWTYTKRSKKSGKKIETSKPVEVTHLNPYDALVEDGELLEQDFHRVSSPIKEVECNDCRTMIAVEGCEEKNSLARSSMHVEECDSEDDNNEDTNENSLDMSEVAVDKSLVASESDVEVTGVEKLKPVEEVSRYKPMDRKQNLERILLFSSKLNLARGGKETEVKNILSGIVDDHHLSKVKDLGPSKEELGRGKRTPIPRRKY